MKLYYAKGTCSLVIHILLHELAISAEIESVDLKTKKTATGTDYFTINVKGSVPALQIDEKILLTENIVIQQYLIDKCGATHLLPAAPDFNHYRALEWANYISTELHENCVPLINTQISEELKESVFKPILNKKLKYVEDKLTDRYLMGPELMLPDIYLFVIISWLPRLGIALADYPKLQNLFNLMLQRPSVQSAISDEKITYLDIDNNK